MSSEEPEIGIATDGMPDLLSALLSQWQDPVEAVAEPPAETALLNAETPLLNIESLLNAWDDERQEIVIEDLMPSAEQTEEVLAEPQRDLVNPAQSMQQRLKPTKEERATEVEAKYRYIAFWMADEAYAIPVSQVIESDKLAEVTSLPRVNESIRGLIHLRGEILPMLDLRLILGCKSTEEEERMLIVRTKNSSGVCGLAVDQVAGLIAIRPEEVEPYPIEGEGKAGNFVSSFCDRHGSHIRLLDLDRMFEGLSNNLAVRKSDV